MFGLGFFGFAEFGDVFLLGHFGPVDRLIAAVLAGGVADAAVDAFFFVDVGDDFVIEVEVAPFFDATGGFAGEVGDGVEAFFGHVVFESAGHGFDDAEAFVHDGGADLEGGCAEEDEFDAVLPGLDAADAREGHVAAGVEFRIGGEGGDHVEGDGFDGGSAVAAVGAEAVDGGAWGEGVEIDAHDAVDGVDE